MLLEGVDFKTYTFDVLLFQVQFDEFRYNKVCKSGDIAVSA